MSQALYRKWRPNQWEQVIGQDHIIQTLRNAVRSGKISHAYLFAGPRGTGKTTTARLLAKAFNCTAKDLAARPCNECENCITINQGRYLDLIEIDAASNTSVDDVRELREKINFSPSQGAYKVYIIDEVHMLSTAAFNALLKTLEEPPPHAIFILATTEVQKIPATVLSRCQRHEFRRIPVNEIKETLRQMCAEEKIQADDNALVTIARQATGSMRDAISLLDQLSSTGDRITLDYAQTIMGTATNQSVIDLVSALLDQNTAGGMKNLHAALDAGTEPRQFSRQIVDYLRGLLLIHMGAIDQLDVPEDVRKMMTIHAAKYPLPGLMTAIHEFNRAAADPRSAWQPALPLEIALAYAITSLGQPGSKEQTVPPGLAPAAPSMLRGKKTEELVQTSTPPPQPEEPSGSTPAAADVSVPSAESQSKPASPGDIEKHTISAPGDQAEAGSRNQVTLNDLEKGWNKINDLIKKKRHQTVGLLNSCQRLTIKNGALVLGFVTEVVRSKMDTPENIDVTRAAILEVLGIPLDIVCIVAGKSGNMPPDLNIDRDGMIGTALNMGGRIVGKE